MKCKQGPGRLKSRKQRYKKVLRASPSKMGACRRDPHEFGNDYGLRKIASQRVGFGKWAYDTART